MMRLSFRERQNLRIQKLAETAKKRREERLVHADKVCKEYEEAYKLAFGRDTKATYDEKTGYYRVSNNPKAMREDALTDAITFCYAKAHEQESAAVD